MVVTLWDIVNLFSLFSFMKTFFRAGLLILLASLPALSYAGGCYTFPSEKLRAGTTTPLTDLAYNTGNNPVGLSNFNVNFSSIYGWSSPLFSWTTNIMSLGGILRPGVTNMPIITTTYPIPIPAVGAPRRTDALSVTYNVEYYEIAGNVNI